MNNFIFPQFSERLARHPKAGSFCCYEGSHFTIQFDCEEYIDGVECYLFESIYKDHPVVLGRNMVG